jgi:hypothetical protein
MAGVDRKALVARLVPALAAQTPLDVEQLAALMLARAWPGGHGDSNDRVASEWLRRWRPQLVTPERVGCSCERGRCLLCN